MKIKLLKGKVRWYYTIVGNNGETIAVSQKYFSKSNAKRAARKVALNLGGVEVVND
jgi:uncharacterized protein YegP (UPF0339 family)